MPRGVKSFVESAALTFGAATSDRVDIGSGATIDALDPFTLYGWFFPTTLTANRLLYSKNGAAANRVLLNLSGTVGDVQVQVIRAVNTSYITNTTPLATLSAWAFLAATFNSAAAAGQIVNIYKGTLAVLAAEAAYGTATDGSGAVTSDAANNGMWGNNGNAAAAAFQGRIGPCGIVKGELSLTDIWGLQGITRAALPIAVPARASYLLGSDGTVLQRDGSGNGNAGTVTGATVSRGVPLLTDPVHRLGRQPMRRAA